MRTHTGAIMPEESERAAVDAPVVAFPEAIRPCLVCGQAMTGRQTSACPDKRRAAKSRGRRAEAQAERGRRVCALLETAVGILNGET